MDRHILVESPDTGKMIDIWACDESELREACAKLAEQHPYDTVRPLPACFTPKVNTIVWRY